MPRTYPNTPVTFLKCRNLFLGFKQCHPHMLALLQDLMYIWPEGGEIIITSFDRTAEEDKGWLGLHSAGPPWRACDLRTWGLTTEEKNNVCKALNDKWFYDPERPHLGVAYGKDHGTAPHIHLQVHPNTTRKPDNDT